MGGSRLALGTAQFGSVYGIANRSGQVTSNDGAAILRLARDAGLDTIDTAIAYGKSEEVLGRLGMAGWRIVTKLPAIERDERDVARWVEKSVAGCLARLGVSTVYGLLLHHPEDLLAPCGPVLYRALAALRQSRMVGKIGVSIYDPGQLDALMPRFDIDLVQAPFNVLDRRLQTSGWIDRLSERGVELHTRSAFLQGLLVMPADRRPPAFERWSRLWAAWDRWLVESRQTPLEACLGFVLAEARIERVVVGVDTARHMSEIVAAARPASRPLPGDISSSDRALIDPSTWSAA